MENLLGEMMLGGLGIVIVILSFTRWTRDRAVTLGIGGWFLALALSLVFEKALLFTILLGEPVGVAAIVAGFETPLSRYSNSALNIRVAAPEAGSAADCGFCKGRDAWNWQDFKKYHVDIVRHSTDVYAGHGMERIGKYAVIDQTESVFMDRFL